MHAIWKGTVQVARLNVPVKLYAATEDKELSLRQTHASCGGPVSHLKYCSACDAKVEAGDIRKVYELGGGNFIELSDEELKGISPQSSKTLAIEQFVDESEVSRIRLKKHYYLGADEVGEEAFRLLHSSLLQTKKIGIGYITLRSVQSLASIWASEEGLALSTMLYEDEVRPMAAIRAESRFGAVPSPAPEAHLFVFRQLIQAMSTPFAGSKYVNKQDEALRSLIDHKLSKLAPRNRLQEEQALPRYSGYEDLLASLQSSLGDVKGDGEAISPADYH